MKKITFTKMGNFFEALGDNAAPVAAATGRRVQQSKIGPTVGIPYHEIYSLQANLEAEGYQVEIN